LSGDEWPLRKFKGHAKRRRFEVQKSRRDQSNYVGAFSQEKCPGRRWLKKEVVTIKGPKKKTKKENSNCCL